MKRNALKTLTLLCVVLCCGLGTLYAQEQQEKKIAYNFINEYGFFVGKNVGLTGVFINGISIKQNDNIGIGVGYGLNSGTLQEIPIFLNYRHYFDRGRRLKPLINIAAGVALHYWTDEIGYYDPNNTDPWGYPIYNYVEENKHGIGVYGTIAGGFRVRAFSFTGGFFFRTIPSVKGFGGGIEAKVGYTF